MKRIIILIILLFSLTSCNSQVKRKESNFQKLSKIDIQIKNKLTNEKTYKSLDSLKNIVDGADSELYIETYKDAIVYDTKKLLFFLKSNNKQIDEDVVSFFEQDEKLYNIINEKLERTITAKNKIDLISSNSKWKKNCDESFGSVSIIKDLGVICVNANQIYINSKIKKSEKKNYEVRLIKPMDLGRGGMELEWKNFSKDSIIATIEVIDEGSINFKWLGFYNLKSNNREWIKESDFSSEITSGIRLEKCLQRAKIIDPDGYTNLRKEKNTSSEILQKIVTGSQIEVLDNSGDWWLVQTKEGKKGYVYKTKIKAE